MNWYVYIVQCIDGTFYTGITSDLDRRMAEHNYDNKLGSRFVRVRRPVKLVYKEQVTDRSTGLKRELEIKAWSRKKKFALIVAKRASVDISTCSPEESVSLTTKGA